MRVLLRWFVCAWLSFSSVVMMVLMLAELSTTFGAGVSTIITGLTLFCTVFLASEANKEGTHGV